MELKMESASRLNALFLHSLGNELCPAFIIEESNYNLVFVNDIISKELGDIVGQTCYNAFHNREKVCAFCPEKPVDKCDYTWESYNEKTGKSYKVSTTWKDIEGKTYRMTMAADTSDIMSLNRSITDYLWLMEQLSEMQVCIMNDQKHTVEIILNSLRELFDVATAGAEWMTKNGLHRFISDDEGSRELEHGDVLPDGGEQLCVREGEESVTFFLYAPRRYEGWRENKGMVLRIAELYLENDWLRRRAEWEISHDKATSLYNRAAFRQHSRESILDWTELTVVFLDIDNLKNINDALGHDMGDKLIAKAADILLSLCGEGASAYRMGGDEFILLARMNEQEAEQVCAKIETLVAESNERMVEPWLYISLGAASGTDPKDVEKLLRLADAKMYESKRAHKMERGE